MLRLPGVMVKGTGKDLWVRIGKKAQAQGIGLKELAAVLSARIQEEFPEIESVQACFLRGKGPIYQQLDQISEVFYQNSEKLKAKTAALTLRIVTSSDTAASVLIRNFVPMSVESDA